MTLHFLPSYDFFLVSQKVRQGTVTPTHYTVVHDSSTLKPDHMQRLAYKMTHMYYNWPGTVRVPAPCQVSHMMSCDCHVISVSLTVCSQVSLSGWTESAQRPSSRAVRPPVLPVEQPLSPSPSPPPSPSQTELNCRALYHCTIIWSSCITTPLISATPLVKIHSPP